MRPSTNGFQRRLRFESLEDRRLMAGDIVAFMRDGALIINEGGSSVGSSSAIQLSNTGPLSTDSVQTIRVRGVTHPDGTVTRIGDANGQNFTPYKDFHVGEGDLFISTGAGSDVIEFMPGTFLLGNLDVKTSNDSATYFTDSDQVYFDQVLAWKNVKFSTGTGDDLLDIQRSGVRRDYRLDVNMGFGNDTVLMYGANPWFADVGNELGFIRIQTYQDRNHTASDSDIVDIQDSTASNLGILTGGDADRVSIRNTRANRVTVYTDGGNDSLYLDDLRALDALRALDLVFASLGEGDDLLNLGPQGVAANVFDVYGDGGIDTLTRPTGSPVPNFRIKSGFENETTYGILLGSKPSLNDGSTEDQDIFVRDFDYVVDTFEIKKASANLL